LYRAIDARGRVADRAGRDPVDFSILRPVLSTLPMLGLAFFFNKKIF